MVSRINLPKNIPTYRGSAEVSFKVHLTNGYEVDFAPVIASGQFTRLYDVGQLDCIDRVIPNARHTRYEHSLGVFYLAQEFIQGRRHKLPPYRQFLLLATALLHDIGHGPRSHVYDIVAKAYIDKDHKTRTQEVISELSEELKTAGGSHFEDNDISGDIKRLLSNGSPLAKLVSSKGVSFDKLDYVFRDSYYCVGDGADTTGNIRAIMDNLYFDGQRAAVSRGVMHHVKSFLHGIIHNNIYIYIRPDVETLEAFEMRAIVRAVTRGKKSKRLNLNEGYQMTDAQLMQFLKENDGSRDLVNLVESFSDSSELVTAASIRYPEGREEADSDPKMWMGSERITGEPNGVQDLVYISGSDEISELNDGLDIKKALPKLVKLETNIRSQLGLSPTELAIAFSPQIDRLELEDESTTIVSTKGSLPRFRSIFGHDRSLRASMRYELRRLYAIRLITTRSKADKVQRFVKRSGEDIKGKGHTGFLTMLKEYS